MPADSTLTTTEEQGQAMTSTLALESAFYDAAGRPDIQAAIRSELEQRAMKGDPVAESSAALMEGQGPTGVPVPPARPAQFLGSVDQPLNLIPSSLDMLGNPAL